MRVLEDQTQRQRKAHIPGSRVCVSRSGLSSAGDCIATMPTNEITFIGQGEAQARVRAGWAKRAVYEAMEAGRVPEPAPRRSAPVRPPARFYRPQDQGPLLPQFAIYDRETGVVLARIRGTREFIHNEALKLAGAHGGSLKDLTIKLEMDQ